MWEPFETKSPARLKRSLVFLFSGLRFASERRSENKNPSFASLRGNFVEVGGGFEPPFPVLQTDS
jgi:hypothetical protein